MTSDILSIYAAMSDVDNDQETSHRDTQNQPQNQNGGKFHGEAPSSGNANRDFQAHSTSRSKTVRNKSRKTATKQTLDINSSDSDDRTKAYQLYSSSDDSDQGSRDFDFRRKKNKHKSRRHIHSLSSSSDSSSNSSSDSSSSSDSEDSSRVSRSTQKHKQTERTERDCTLSSSVPRSVISETISTVSVYERFNPVKKVKNNNSLNDEMMEYVHKNFNEFIKDDDIETSILSTAPVPDCSVFKTKSMDDFVEPLLERKHRSLDKGADKGIASIQTRILRTMGPLSKLWTIVDGLRQQAEKKTTVDEVDIHSICNLVEKTVCLVGQSSLTVDFHRRLNTILKLSGDYKTAKAIVGDHSDVLANSGDKLFGENFMKVLKRAGKRRKDAEDVADTFQPHKKRRKKFEKRKNVNYQRNTTYGYSGYQNNRHSSYQVGYRGDRHQTNPRYDQPFQRRPSGKFRGSGGRKRYQGNPRYDRFVQLSTKCKSKGDNSREQIKVRRLVRLVFSSKVRNHHSSYKKSGVKAYRPIKPSTNRRKTKILSPKLAANNKRSSYSADNSRCLSKFHSRSSSNRDTICPSTKSKRKNSIKHRNSKSDDKICYRSCPTQTRSVHKQYVHSSQKRRRSPSHYKSATPESIYSVPSFQDGGSVHGSRSSPTNEFYVQTRSQGRLPCCSNSPTSPEVSSLLVEQKTVPIQMSSIRLSPSASYLHKTSKTHCWATPKSRSKTYRLSRRYAFNSRQQRQTCPTQRHYSVSSPVTGTGNKQRKIKFPTISNNFLSGFRNKLGENAVHTTRQENLRNKTKMQRNSDISICLGSRIGKINRQVSVNHAGHNSSQPAVSVHANGSNTSTSHKSKLRKLNPHKQCGERRTVLVDQPNRTIQRPVHNNPQSRFGHHYRRFKFGVGRNRRQHSHRRGVDSVRKRIAHKCKGIASYSVSYSVASKIKRKYFNSLAIRQHNNRRSHKQNGRYTVRHLKSSNKEHLGLVSKQKHFLNRRVYPGQTKCNSRLGIQKCGRFRRLDAKQVNFSTTCKATRQLRNRPVCITSQLPTTEISQLETRSRCASNRRISNALERSQGICFSPIFTGGSLPSQNNEGKSYPNFSNTYVASPTLVPNVTTNDHRSTNTTSYSNKSSYIPIRPNSSTARKPKSQSCSMESFGGPPETYSLSNNSASLYAQAWRPGTRASYKSAWGKWSSWCNSREIDPVHAPLESVIEFLTSLYHENKQYRTINTYRSAISRGHVLIDGMKIGQHPHIITHMRAIFNVRTPSPRYQDSWDVDTVLQFLTTLGDNSDLTLKMLTFKLTTLLALTSAGRASEINQLNIKLMQDQSSKLIFSLSKPTKTCRPGKPLPCLTFHEFEDSNLCVVRCLRHYISRTQEFRETPDRVDRTWLMLSMVKPHHPVTTSSVSRWVKQTLSLAGINTNIFKAHSTRAAATSKAFNSGVSVHDILKQARWSNTSTFTRFYCRPLVSHKETNFQHTVLTRQ